CDASEVDADLATEYERVVDPSGAAGLNDVLEVRLDKQRAPREVEAISQLDRHFVVLDAEGWIDLLRLPLRILEVFAEMAVHDAETARIGGTCVEDAPRRDAGGEEEGHLLHAGVRGEHRRAEDAEPAIALARAEGNQHLVEQAVEAP